MRKISLTFAILAFLFISISGGPFHSKSARQASGLLAETLAPVSTGASLAAVVGLVGAPIDSVFALRGGETTDFWHYSISKNEWSMLPATPAPVGGGGGIVEVASHTFCKPGLFYVAALRGGNTPDFWYFNIDQNSWCIGPSTPSPVGPGGAIAQLQGQGKIYVLRGNGTRDFWSFENGKWEVLANTPGPVNAGGGLVGLNFGSTLKNVLFALQGGGSTALWKYETASNNWTQQSEVPGAVGAGGAISMPNIGGDPAGTLNVLQGGESTSVWSLQIDANTWKLLDNTPSAVVAGGALSSQVNGCDFAFVGEGSRQFFATGQTPCLPDPPGFSLSFDRPAIAVERGTKVKVKIMINRTGMVSGNIRIVAPPNLPTGIKLPEELPPLTGDTMSFKIKIKGSTQGGTHNLIFVGSDDNGRRSTATLSLIVP